MKTGRCIALMLSAALVGILIWVGLGVALYLGHDQASARSSSHSSTQAACDNRGLGSDCTEIPLEKIAKASELDLPPGTEVLSSKYQQFQDWVLDADLRLPVGSPSPLDSPSGRRYYPLDVTSSPSAAAELRSYGVPTARSYGSTLSDVAATQDGVYYTARSGQDAQGRQVLRLHLFTT